MKNSSKMINIYKKDCQFLQDKLLLMSEPGKLLELEKSITSKKKNIEELKTKNKSFNKHRSPGPRKSMFSDKMKEISCLNNKNRRLENQIEKEKQGIESLENHKQILSSELDSLNAKYPISEPHDNTDLQKRHQELERELRLVQAKARNKSEQSKRKVKELSLLLKQLDEEEISLQTRILKKRQQSRMLTLKEEDFNQQLSVDFIYTPTVKSLYNS